MDLADASAASCLRTLLEDQAARLGGLVHRISEATGSGLRVTPAEEWTGLARNAHDECVRRLTTELDQVRSCLERAASETSQAVSTLADRV